MDAFLRNHLKGVSRTYALLIPMLPGDLSEAVGLSYLLMRIVDTLEDAPELTAAQRADGFARLDAALRFQPGIDGADTRPAHRNIFGAAALAGAPLPIAGETAAERALMAEARAVVARVRALPPVYRDAAIHCAAQMSAGVLALFSRSGERGLEYPGNRDAKELREYCYYVAGVVGEMLCTMMSHYLRTPRLLRLRELAIELGIGLQLVNILKDCLTDASNGRRYLPITTGGDVALAEIYRVVLEQARESLRRGVDFVLALPPTARELRSFCGLPIAWGAMTLARAERNATKAKVGRGAIRSSIDLFAKLSGDDTALRRWFDSMLRPASAV